MTPIRVLTLTTLFPNRAEPGLGVNVERQLTRLAARDEIDLTVIAPIPRLPLSLPVGRFSGLRDVPHVDDGRGFDVHHPAYLTLPKIGWRFHAGTITQAAVPLAEALHRERRFDLVAGEYFFPDAMPVHRIARALQVPYVLKARGSDIKFWAGRNAARRQMVGAGRHASAVLSVSQGLKRDMVAMGLSRERIAVHYTATDLSLFRPGAAEKHGVPTLVAVGNLVDVKRVDLILNALRHLDGVHLRIIGDGPLRGALGKQVKSQGLADRVTFLGRVQHDELAREYAAAHALVHAAASEGLANVWVEALASGTPVVTTDVGGAKEVVLSQSGKIVPADVSARGFASAVKQVLDSPPDAELVRASAERFSWKHNLDELAELYSRVVSKA